MGLDDIIGIGVSSIIGTVISEENDDSEYNNEEDSGSEHIESFVGAIEERANEYNARHSSAADSNGSEYNNGQTRNSSSGASLKDSSFVSEALQHKIVKTAPKQPRDYGFQPGQSGNPNGRPKGVKNGVYLHGPLLEEVLVKLELMSKRQLISLIRRVSGSVWGIGIMTPEEALEAIKLKYLYGGLSEGDIYKALPPLKEYTDRQFGKAAQSLNLTVEDIPLAKMTTSRLAELEAALARSLGEDAILPPAQLKPLAKPSNED